MYQYFIGIDISKNSFSTATFGNKKTKDYSNNLEGFSSFFEDHKSFLKNGLVVLETTGGYELALIHYLQNYNSFVHRANARKVKYFIRSLGQMAKTDAIDAIGLAHYGHERHAGLELFEANPQQKLLKLVQRRIELKQMLVQEKNRRQAPDQRELLNSFNAIIKAIEGELNVIDSEIQSLCKLDKSLSEKKKILKTIKGIGDVTAIELLALLPELGKINRRKIASLAGLAPFANDSGKNSGYRSTRGGRKEIKPILFMAAMSSSRSNSIGGEFYKKLVNGGKKKMVAMTALMRKILIIANARLRDFYNFQKISQHG